MSVVLSLRSGIVSAGICCLVASLALAQQDQSGQSSSSGSQGSESSQSTSGQSDRSSSAQSGRAGSQSSSGTSQTSGAYGAQFATAGQGREVEQYLAGCLLADNQAEVQLSQFAQQRAKSNDVKEFAQMMVQDHQKMIQQLQQLSGTSSSAGRSGGQSSSATESGQTSTTAGSSAGQSSGTSSVAGTESRNSNAGTAGSSATDTTGAGSSGTTTGRSAGAGSSSQPGGGSSVSSLGAGGATASSAATGSGAVQQLMQIDRQIVERKTQQTREELQQKSGEEFDKGFVGTAISAHIHALAALEVIGQQSQGQLAQVAQQARPTVQQHLEHAKQLMKKLEGEGGSSSTAARSTESRTER